MEPVKDLKELLKNMNPVLSPNTYYICTADKIDKQILDKSILYFKEKEGVTLVLEEKYSNKVKGKKSGPHALITLNVYSDLSAVGFLAAILGPLAEAGISVNVVSAYYHDRLFVPKQDAQKSMQVLQKLSRT